MRSLIAAAALLAASLLPAHATEFRAPQVAAPSVVALPAMLEKRAGASMDASGRLRVGVVRGLQKAASVPAWTPVEGGWITRFTASSAGAQGLRVQLVLAELPGPVEVRVKGSGDAIVETQVVDPKSGPEAWTPWTEGETQTIEIFSAVQPWSGGVRIGAVVHFTDSPFTKAAAGSCTVPIACSTNDAVIDAAISQAKKSIMSILFNEGSLAFVCTATLIDTARNPDPYVMTANHCINDPAVAQTITSFWFFQNASCDSSSPKTKTQVPGGMQLVFGNHNVDSTLLLMNGAPPAGSLYAPMDRAKLAPGQSMVSLSHPGGDAARLALGSVVDEQRFTERPQNFFEVRFTRGIIEGGSSGSALFTLSNGSLVFRGTLLGTTTENSSNGMSCTDTNESAIYSRFDIFAPEIDAYIGTAAVAPDDAPNRPLDLFGQLAGAPLDTVTARAIDGLRIDYAGDLDTFKFALAAPAVVTAWSEGPNGANLDTVGALLDENGSWINSNDDAQTSSNHFGLTSALDAGVYYVQVGHYEPDGTGPYNLKLRADVVSAKNYTDLWYTSTESGWGLNINHQGNLLFASLFTYDAAGIPVWLAMSDGARQADGSYLGTLARYTGAPFNGSWHAAVPIPVGTMHITFNSDTTATLQYTFNGTLVTKSIARFVFSKAVSCSWSAFDRSFADNYQDLWYNPAEPGWGINLAHQDKTMFASLFTYDANGNALWLVMSAGAQTANGKFSGDLYKTSGPPFNASPWVPAVSTSVGTMNLVFTDGNHGTLTYTNSGVAVTKAIQRFEFGPLKPDCSSN